MIFNLGSGILRLTTDAGNFIKGLQDSETALGKFSIYTAQIANGFSSLGVQLGLIGASLGTALGEAAKFGGDFQHQMKITEAVAGGTVEELDKLSKTAKELAQNSLFAPTEIASAMNELAKAGQSAQQIGETIKSVTSLATAAGTDLEEAAASLVAVTAQFGLSANQSELAADSIVKAANLSLISVTDLMTSLRYVGSVAAEFGNSLQDVAAIIATLGKANVRGSGAGTATQRIITDIIRDAPKMQKGIERVNIAAGKTIISLDKLNPATNSLVQIINQLALLSPSQITSVFGVEASRNINTLVGLIDTLNDYRQELQTTNGEAQRAAAIIQDDFNGAVTELNATLQVLFIEVFDKVAPKIITWIDNTKAVVREMIAWVKVNSDLTNSFILFGTAFAGISLVVGPIILLASQLISSASVAVGLIAAIATSLGSLITIITSLGTLGGLVTSLVPTLAYLVTVIGSIAFTSTTFIGGIVASISGSLLPLLTQIGITVGGIGSLAAIPLTAIIALVTAGLIPVIYAIYTNIEQVWDIVKQFLSSCLDLIKPLIGTIASLYTQWVSPIFTEISDFFRDNLLPNLSRFIAAVFDVLEILKPLQVLIGGGLVLAFGVLVRAVQAALTILNALIFAATKLLENVGFVTKWLTSFVYDSEKAAVQQERLAKSVEMVNSALNKQMNTLHLMQNTYEDRVKREKEILSLQSKATNLTLQDLERLQALIEMRKEDKESITQVQEALVKQIEVIRSHLAQKEKLGQNTKKERKELEDLTVQYNELSRELDVITTQRNAGNVAIDDTVEALEKERQKLKAIKEAQAKQEEAAKTIQKIREDVERARKEASDAELSAIDKEIKAIRDKIDAQIDLLKIDTNAQEKLGTTQGKEQAAKNRELIDALTKSREEQEKKVLDKRRDEQLKFLADIEKERLQAAGRELEAEKIEAAERLRQRKEEIKKLFELESDASAEKRIQNERERELGYKTAEEEYANRIKQAEEAEKKEATQRERDRRQAIERIIQAEKDLVKAQEAIRNGSNEATNDVADANQQLIEARQKVRREEADLNKMLSGNRNKKGQPQVVSKEELQRARDSLNNAKDDVRKAEIELKEKQRAIGEADKEAQERVADAANRVKDALLDAKERGIEISNEDIQKVKEFAESEQNLVNITELRTRSLKDLNMTMQKKIALENTAYQAASLALVARNKVEDLQNRGADARIIEAAKLRANVLAAQADNRFREAGMEPVSPFAPVSKNEEKDNLTVQAAQQTIEGIKQTFSQLPVILGDVAILAGETWLNKWQEVSKLMIAASIATAAAIKGAFHPDTHHSPSLRETVDKAAGVVNNTLGNMFNNISNKAKTFSWGNILSNTALGDMGQMNYSFASGVGNSTTRSNTNNDNRRLEMHVYEKTDAKEVVRNVKNHFERMSITSSGV